MTSIKTKRKQKKYRSLPVCSFFIRYIADNQIQKWAHNENHLIKETIYSISCIVCTPSSSCQSVIYLSSYWEPYIQTICRWLVDFRFVDSRGYLFLSSPLREVSNKFVLTLAVELLSLTVIFFLLLFIVHNPSLDCILFVPVSKITRMKKY